MEHISKTFLTLPRSPGVYLFKDSAGVILYVGKAKNLANRVRQYFTSDGAIGGKTRRLVPQIRAIEVVQTDTEFDALIQEAKLIHAYQPKYNAIAKDDKSPLYMVVTRGERLPRIFFSRKRTLEPHEVGRSTNRFIAGPFQSSRIARTLLGKIRRAIPFCTEKHRTGNACFYTHLGLCAPCPSVIEKMPEGEEKSLLIRSYRKNIVRITTILSGRSKYVIRQIERDMEQSAKSLRFEEATALRQELLELRALITRPFDPHIFSDERLIPGDKHLDRLGALSKFLKKSLPDVGTIIRIECIDIAHIGGSWTTGSLVVFTQGSPDTSLYRRFRIKMPQSTHDASRIREIIVRRMKHTEWDMPGLVVVDGGKPQVRAAYDALGSLSIPIPVIGLSKRFEEIILFDGTKFNVCRLPLDSQALLLLQHLRDEAHRFARSYHTKLRALSFNV